MKKLQPLPFEKKPLLFAHRGVSSLAPENTLASFKLAKEMGIPGIELDIHPCKTGELVVFHDDNVKRICGKDVSIEELSLKEIKDLDAGIWKDKKFANEKIPTLRELFECLGNEVYYDIEIKHRSKERAGVEEKLAELVREFKLENKIVISSFNPFPLKWAKEVMPTIPTGIIYCNDAELPKILRLGEGKWIASCDFLKPQHTKVNPVSVFFNKTLGGRKIIPWTVDSKEVAKKLLKDGVTGLISNRPQDLIELCNY